MLLWRRTTNWSNWIFRFRISTVQELVDRAEASRDYDQRCNLLASAIRECATNAQDAHLLHQRILELGLGRDRFVMNLLVEMYGKMGDLTQATHVFQTIPVPNAFSWTILIVAFAQNGHLQQALFFFRRMEQQGIKVTIVTCAAVLGIAASLKDLALGRWMHDRIIHQGLRINTVVENSLVNLYGRCGCLSEARAVFGAMAYRDVVAWTSLVAAFARGGHFAKAVAFFRAMALDGIRPNDITFSAAIEAVSGSGDLAQGCVVHAMASESGSPVDWAEIVAMYGRCGGVANAEMAFEAAAIDNRDVALYNAMITVYAQHGRGDLALQLIQRMRDSGIDPDEGSFARVLSSLSCPREWEQGRAIHGELSGSSGQMGTVLQTSIVKMYLNAGWIDEAEEIFSRMEPRDMFAWTVMITALTERGRAKEALDLFRQTRLEGLDLNRVAIVSALDACAGTGSMRDGAQIHAMAMACPDRAMDTVLGSVLVNLYGKCGDLRGALAIFRSIPSRDVVVWNSMAGVYAHHGHHDAAVSILRAAALDAIALSQVSFQCLLYSCSHHGRLREARESFLSMIGDHGVDPSDEHFRCMVDLLARAGKIDRAEELLLESSPPFAASGGGGDIAWTMILGACRLQCDIVRGDRVAASLAQTNSTDVDLPYVLLSNMLQELAL